MLLEQGPHLLLEPLLFPGAGGYGVLLYFVRDAQPLQGQNKRGAEGTGRGRGINKYKNEDLPYLHLLHSLSNRHVGSMYTCFMSTITGLLVGFADNQHHQHHHSSRARYLISCSSRTCELGQRRNGLKLSKQYLTDTYELGHDPHIV